MKNQECKTRPQIININSNNPIFYPFSIIINKFSGNCNNINNPYAKIRVPDVINDLNVKVFNLMSRTTQRVHHVESTWIRRGYYVDMSKTKFRQVSTSFPRTFSM